MNYNQWIQQTAAIFDRVQQKTSDAKVKIQPPLLTDEARELSANWKHIPGELMDFWLTGSAQISAHYFWQLLPSQQERLFGPNERYLYGGVNFRTADMVFPGNSADLLEGMDEFRESVGDIAFVWWTEFAIFHDSMNGDCLAIGAEMGDDPPVYYLSAKDNRSKKIADHFSEFLRDWQTLCFIAPETHLNHWLGPSGRINVDLYKTAELRTLLLSDLP
ncbi:MAG: SMI1/KNR4 family protein [Pirellulales bacterium]